MKTKRPINLALTTIRFPSTAIASILHRVSGFAVFLLVPFLLWMLHASLYSQQSFENLKDILAYPVMTLLLWALLAGLIYHFLAGIRHLLMDAHIGETVSGAKKSAYLVIIGSIVLFIIVGVLLW